MTQDNRVPTAGRTWRSLNVKLIPRLTRHPPWMRGCCRISSPASRSRRRPRNWSARRRPAPCCRNTGSWPTTCCRILRSRSMVNAARSTSRCSRTGQPHTEEHLRAGNRLPAGTERGQAGRHQVAGPRTGRRGPGELKEDHGGHGPMRVGPVDQWAGAILPEKGQAAFRD